MSRTKRIALALDPKLHDKLYLLAKYQNKPVVNVVNDLLLQALPVIDLTILAFQQIEAGFDSDTILDNFAQSLAAVTEQKFKDITD